MLETITPEMETHLNKNMQMSKDVHTTDSIWGSYQPLKYAISIIIFVSISSNRSAARPIQGQKKGPFTSNC